MLLKVILISSNSFKYPHIAVKLMKQSHLAAFGPSFGLSAASSPPFPIYSEVKNTYK